MNTLTKTNNDLRVRNFFPRSFFTDDFFNLAWPKDFFTGTELINLRIPAANVKEDEKAFTLELSTPGYAKKDISVNIENNMLIISGEHNVEKSKEKKNYTRQEFSQDSFSRTFELPANVNEGNISAKCVDGVLTVTLPKAQLSEPKKKITKIPVA